MKREGIKTMAIWGLLLAVVLLGLGFAGISATGSDGAIGVVTLAGFGLAGSIMAGGGARISTRGAQMINWEKGMKEFGELKDADPRKVKNLVVSSFDKYIRKMAKQPVSGQKIRGADPGLMAEIPVVEVISDPNAVADPDRGYELIFKEIDMRQTRNKTFKILDVTSGITYYQVEPGGEWKMSKIPTSSSTSVEMIRFIGGLPILDDWLKYNETYLIDQLFEDAVLSWWDTKATIFYGMLVALDGSINVAFDSDISTTINKACAAILKDMKKMKAKNMGPKRFVITCRENDRFKIAKALAASFMNANTNLNEIVYTIQAVVPTTYLPDNENYFYVSLPGGKNVKGEWEDFNARPAQRNELTLGADHVWTGAYNGGIFNGKQHRRCLMS